MGGSLREDLTLNQFKRRGLLLNKCCMCKGEEELVDDILLHCSETRILWQLVYSLFGIVSVMHSLVRGTLLN